MVPERRGRGTARLAAAPPPPWGSPRPGPQLPPAAAGSGEGWRGGREGGMEGWREVAAAAGAPPGAGEEAAGPELKRAMPRRRLPSRVRAGLAGRGLVAASGTRHPPPPPPEPWLARWDAPAPRPRAEPSPGRLSQAAQRGCSSSSPRWDGGADPDLFFCRLCRWSGVSGVCRGGGCAGPASCSIGHGAYRAS